jgi:predicted CoA-substrate-specific enzyme activase
MRLGLDVGSTTIKAVVLDDQGQIVYRTYTRHKSQVKEKTREILTEVSARFGDEKKLAVAITGSAGLGVSELSKIDFVQEVYADSLAAKRLVPKADVLIELGGEDAKVVFLTGLKDARMNGTCAGDTGAFIDQMASLLKVSTEELNDLAKAATTRYVIASRCGVFAKSDVQPLLNQGAKREDVASSILYSVVNQTVAGLAQGRKLKGQVVYLGGPLTFLSELRKAFDDVLGIEGLLPEDSLYFAAIGAALYANTIVDFKEKIELFQQNFASTYEALPPLFENQAQYDAFVKRHQKAQVLRCLDIDYDGFVHLGIDCGSTTLKTVLLSEDGRILDSTYAPNDTNPVEMAVSVLKDLYQKYPNLKLASVTSTGYGEQLIKQALNGDDSLVETMAHYRAAVEFEPECDFVIDIGGQDIKCFKIADGSISDIFLNEACSSGCGSFLATFSEALDLSPAQFSRLALFAKQPVMLGSRCTVFMNSLVKQAQRDGATLADIAAGLAISVVKNALYKVIRTTNPKELGAHILVQGGTFASDAVLRAFELELNLEVTRPEIAGLMGAYGAALYGKDNWDHKSLSNALSVHELDGFTHSRTTSRCGLCENHCLLTINRFAGDRLYLSGNRCERPLAKKPTQPALDLTVYKRQLLAEYQNYVPKQINVGLPLVLNFFETLPFWHTFFTELGFGVCVSSPSDGTTYASGQADVLSDTACYPAKIVHGHIRQLASDESLAAIFYPCMPYNIDEGGGENHYNCPVVATYPEAVAVNYQKSHPLLLYPYIGLHQPKKFVQQMSVVLKKLQPKLHKRDLQKAADKAYKAYDDYLAKVQKEGQRIIEEARSQGRHIIVLAGRPYHLDEQVNHGISRLITKQNAAVVTEDCFLFGEKQKHQVLNQWTYHNRLYNAALAVGQSEDMDLVQLVSFGCGLDAITGDEVKEILQRHNKLYTQLKIDEIVNLGAIEIRIRSLFAALAKKQRKGGKQNAIYRVYPANEIHP